MNMFCQEDHGIELNLAAKQTRHELVRRWGLDYAVAHDRIGVADSDLCFVTHIKCFGSDMDKARLAPHSAFHGVSDGYATESQTVDRGEDGGV